MSQEINLKTEVIENLDPSVLKKLKHMDGDSQEMFERAYLQDKKKTWVAYLLSLIFFHRWYLGSPGLTVLFWVVAIITVGVGSFIWWVVDLFLIPKKIREVNGSIAMDKLRLVNL